MSENTSQGQGQGPGVQGNANQPQSQGTPGAFQSLQREQGAEPENQGTSEQRGAPQYESPDVATSERGQQPWSGQGRERQNYQPDTSQAAQRPHEYERTARGEQPRDSSGEYVRADEVDRLIQERLAKRDEQHAKETAKLRNQVPQLVVAQNGGGPGNDQHQTSWNLAEQEAASRGDVLDHWEIDE